MVIDPKTGLTFEEASKQGVNWTAPAGAYDSPTTQTTAPSQQQALSNVASAFGGGTPEQEAALKNVMSAFQPMDMSAVGGTTPLDLEPAGVPDDTKDAFMDIATETGAILSEGAELHQIYQDMLKQLAEQQKTFFDKAKEMIAGRPKIDMEAIMKGLHEQYGIPEYYERLQSQIPKIDALNRQMIDLQTREQQSLMASEQRMAPMTFIRGEQALIQRQYAVEKASVAAQLGAETALAEMYKGNINMARTLIGDVVQALTYDYNQQVADWEMNFNLYQDYFSALDSSTQKALDMAYNEIVRQRDRKEKEYDTLLNAWLELKAQGAEPFPFNKIKNMDYEEGMKKIAETIAAQPTEADMLSVAEAKSLGVPYGTTRAQAMGMGITPTKPEKLALFWSREDMDREQPPVWFDEIYRKITNMPPDTSIAPPMYKKVWDQYRYQVIREGWTIPSPAAQQALELEGLDWRVPSERRKALEHLHKREILLYGPGN